MPASMAEAITPSSSRVVAAFLLLGFWKLGTPLLMASTPVRAAAPEEKARSSRKAPASPTRPSSKPACRHDREGCGRRLAQLAGDGLEDADGGHAQDGRHEDVGGDGEDAAGFLDAAQVHEGQDDHADGGDQRLLAVQ